MPPEHAGRFLLCRWTAADFRDGIVEHRVDPVHIWRETLGKNIAQVKHAARYVVVLPRFAVLVIVGGIIADGRRPKSVQRVWLPNPSVGHRFDGHGGRVGLEDEQVKYSRSDSRENAHEVVEGEDSTICDSSGDRNF